MSLQLAQLLFPNVKNIKDILNQYPPRPSDQMVTRVAPSPTGFCHTGLIYTGLLNNKLTKQNQGVFILRIEDTDQARNTTNFEEKTGGAYSLVHGLNFFGIDYDEGIKFGDNKEFINTGNYGPYVQSERLDIYHSLTAYLLETDQAYVCFMTPQELENMRTAQQASKQATGVYGPYALSRNLSYEQIIANIEDGKEYVIRRKSNNKPGDKVTFEDGIKGTVNMDANYADQIIIKSDKFPSFALAHITDDYLMGTTHVIRADEWLASVPYHMELFGGFKGVFTRPQRSYNHNSPIQKLDNGNRRKLSKRKDPEADVQVLLDDGFPADGITTYLMCLLNSNFEDRRKEVNQETYTSYKEFEVSLDKCNVAGAIFDMDKLKHICSEYLAIIPLEQLISQIKTFYDNTDQVKLAGWDEDFIKQILDFDRNKKLHTTYQDILEYINPFLQEDLSIDATLFPQTIPQDTTKTILSAYSDYISSQLFDEDKMIIRTKEERFEDLKQFGKQFGIASNNAEFKEGGYVAKIGDLAMILRVALYGAASTPDIYEMIRVLGKERVMKRLSI